MIDLHTIYVVIGATVFWLNAAIGVVFGVMLLVLWVNRLIGGS